MEKKISGMRQITILSIFLILLLMLSGCKSLKFLHPIAGPIISVADKLTGGGESNNRQPNQSNSANSSNPVLTNQTCQMNRGIECKGCCESKIPSSNTNLCCKPDKCIERIQSAAHFDSLGNVTIERFPRGNFGVWYGDRNDEFGNRLFADAKEIGENHHSFSVNSAEYQFTAAFDGCRISISDATSPLGAAVLSPVSGGKLFPDTVLSWDYSPSSMKDGESYKVWWCADRFGVGEPDGEGDIIRYRERINGVWSALHVVLAPNMSGWEGVCTCDPSVVKGEFSYDGKSFSYVMYYTSSPNCKSDNKIGIAFSNDGINWEKYFANPIIKSQWNNCANSATLCASNYGAGQAEAYNVDGKSQIWLIHTDTPSGAEAYQYLRKSSDGINFGPALKIATNGLPTPTVTAASGFAFDRENDMVYIVTRKSDSEYGKPLDLQILRIPRGDLILPEGRWESVAQVPPNFAQSYQFEPGFFTDAYGALPTPISNLEVRFAGSPNYDDSSNWELYNAVFDLGGR